MEKGYYIFGPVLGYKYIELESGGKMLSPCETNAAIMREAFEGLASGRFQSATEVKSFLDLHPSTYRRTRNGIALNSVIELLRNPLYAGFMNIKKLEYHHASG